MPKKTHHTQLILLQDFYDPLKHQSQAPEVVEHTPDYGYQEEKQILAPEKEIAPHHNLQPDTEYNVHGRAQWWTQPSGKICGLRPVTFWLSLALAVVIVVGALAGGVGGALATRHASSNATSSTAVDATGTAGYDDQLVHQILPSLMRCAQQLGLF